MRGITCKTFSRAVSLNRIESVQTLGRSMKPMWTCGYWKIQVNAIHLRISKKTNQMNAHCKMCMAVLFMSYLPQFLMLFGVVRVLGSKLALCWV